MHWAWAWLRLSCLFESLEERGQLFNCLKCQVQLTLLNRSLKKRVNYVEFQNSWSRQGTVWIQARSNCFICNNVKANCGASVRHRVRFRFAGGSPLRLRLRLRLRLSGSNSSSNRSSNNRSSIKRSDQVSNRSSSQYANKYSNDRIYGCRHADYTNDYPDHPRVSSPVHENDAIILINSHARCAQCGFCGNIQRRT